MGDSEDWNLYRRVHYHDISEEYFDVLERFAKAVSQSSLIIYASIITKADADHEYHITIPEDKEYHITFRIVQPNKRIEIIGCTAIPKAQ